MELASGESVSDSQEQENEYIAEIMKDKKQLKKMKEEMKNIMAAKQNNKANAQEEDDSEENDGENMAQVGEEEDL